MQSNKALTYRRSLDFTCYCYCVAGSDRNLKCAALLVGITSQNYFLNCHQTLGKADKLEKKLADLEDRIQDLEEKTEERQQENVNLFKEIHKSLGQLC